MSLPPRVTSVYRLVLRAASAAVLHQPGASRSLRALYRPAFEDAAKVAKELESSIRNENMRQNEIWWVEWERRIDNTLTLLLQSATSSGLGHHLTKNLAMLRTSIYSPLAPPLPYPVWNPSASSATKAPRNQRRARRLILANGVDHVLREAWTAAEGKSGIVLGRIVEGKVDPKRLRKFYRLDEET